MAPARKDSNKKKFPWKEESQASAEGSSDAPQKFPWKEKEEEKRTKTFPWQDDNQVSSNDTNDNQKFPWKEGMENPPTRDRSSYQKSPRKSTRATASSPNTHQSSKSKEDQNEHVTFQSAVDEGSHERGTHNDGVSSVFSQSLGTTIDGASSWAPRQTSESVSASVGSLPSLHQTQNRRRGGKSNQQASKHRRDNDKSNKPKQHEPSLTERIGTSALSSTLGILKLAGGVTLSTTGTILSPSLELTRNLILPTLLTSIADYLSYISPQRLKDWFRILSASVQHVITVIVSTQQGSVFRRKVVRVGGDFVDVISSDQSRQAQMDGVACFIKFSEALHTPEFKAFLEQLSVLGCRVVDVAAMDRNKKLIHDFYDLIWSGVELANDPATTVAMAEVAAYLCHALEMEDAAIHDIGKKREEINQKAAQQRRERDKYQKSTYQDSYLFSDPNATVEEVILSALGAIQKSVEDAEQKSLVLENDIPGSVVLGSEDDDDESTKPPSAMTPPYGVVTGNMSGHDNEGQKDENDSYDENAIHNQDIDVDYLREKITERAETKQQRRLSSFKGTEQAARGASSTISRKQMDLKMPTDGFDDGKKDIEDLDSLALADTPKQSNIALHFEDATKDEDGNLNEQEIAELEEQGTDVPVANSQRDSVKPLEGEAPIAHFYRVLDQTLTSQRKESVKAAATRNSMAELEDQNPEASGLKKFLQSVRSKKRVGKLDNHTAYAVLQKLIEDNQGVVCISVLVVLFFTAIFVGFGCYGMYVFVFPPAQPIISPAMAGSEIHVPVVIHDDMQSQHKHEYVIRVVREVVHVNGKGETLRVETQHSDEL